MGSLSPGEQCSPPEIFLCDFRRVSLGQHLLKYNRRFSRIIVMLGFHYLTLGKNCNSSSESSILDF